MHRSITIAASLVILALAAVPRFAVAQARPDLSGTWMLNFEKSGPEVAGNGAEVPFPSQLIVSQSPSEVSVKGSSVRQNAFTAVYKLDGSRITVAAPSGITETAEAKFEGDTLVIKSRRSFTSPAGETVVEFTELWSRGGNILTVKKTMTQDGESQTATAVYDKAA
jgi:hypothetical protein